MRNWQYKLLALLLAIFVWYLISGREKVDYWMEVPLEVESLPNNYIITGGLPSKIQVRVRATRAVLERLQQGKYNYSLDLSKIKIGQNVIVLDGEAIKLPLPVEVVSFLPPRLEINIDKIAHKNVPVVVDWKSSVRHFERYFKVEEVSSIPNKILVRGPSKILNDVKKIKTKKIIINPFEKCSFMEMVPLDLLPEINSEIGSVNVKIVLSPKRKEFWIVRNIFVENKLKKGKIYLKPSKCRLYISVPLYLMEENKWKKDFKVFVDLQNKGKGKYELPIQVRRSKDILILEKKPMSAKIIIK